MKKCELLKIALIIVFILANFLSFSPATISAGDDPFAKIIAGIGANETTLTISNEQNITADTTVPSNVTLMFMQGGFLAISAGKTVTINGHVDAGLYQIFSGAGSVAGLTHINPAWWGVSTGAIAAVNDAAFTKSIAAFTDTGTWKLSGGIYLTSQVITFSDLSRVKIEFEGRVDTSTNDGILFDAITHSEIYGIDILYPESDWEVTYYGVKFLNCRTNDITINSISRFYYGIYWQADAESGHYNSIRIGQVYDAFYSIYIENINGGSANENSVYGGCFHLTTDHYNDYSGFTGSWGVHFVSPDTHSYNNWKFYNLCPEGLHNGFKLTQTSYTLLVSPRLEGTAVNSNEYLIDVYYNGVPPDTPSASDRLVWILGASTDEFDASKIRLGLTRNLTIIGAGKDGSDYQVIITDNSNGGISWVTEGNIEQSHADLSASHAIGVMYLDDYHGNRLTYNKAYQDSIVPAAGTYRENAVVWNTGTGAGGAMGWVCVANGTMDADPAGMTVTTVAASKVVTVTAGDINDLLPGRYINVAGETFGGLAAGQISNIDYDNDTFNVTSNAGAGVIMAALTYNDATWTVMPAAGGWTQLAAEATPSVLNLEKVVTNGAIQITDFDDGVFGQELKIYAAGNITITDGTNIFLSGSANWAMTATDILHLIQRTDGKWYEMGRSDNGA